MATEGMPGRAGAAGLYSLQQGGEDATTTASRSGSRMPLLTPWRFGLVVHRPRLAGDLIEVVVHGAPVMPRMQARSPRCLPCPEQALVSCPSGAPGDFRPPHALAHDPGLPPEDVVDIQRGWARTPSIRSPDACSRVMKESMPFSPPPRAAGTDAAAVTRIPPPVHCHPCSLLQGKRASRPAGFQ